MTITVTGTNDAATVSSDDVSVAETDSPVSTGGTLTSTDVDDPDNAFTRIRVGNPAITFTGQHRYVLEYVLPEVDLVLVMSVNPGFGGQSYIPSATDKLAEIRAMIDESGYDIDLEVDGGVKIGNIGDVAAAGADMFVAGSAIFGSDDYVATIEEMRKEITAAA